MELPDELYLEIFTHLPQHHLRSVSQTCRTFATLVRPLKFKTIHLDGFPQSRFGRMEKDECVMYPGRSRTVELSALDSTVNELITLDIARHVQALKFSPKYYVDGFWSAYRQWLEMETSHDDDFERMHEDGDFETDSDGEYVGIRRLAAERLARPEKEREQIDQAEAIWAAKVNEQREKAAINLSALVTLFSHMPCLKAIEVKEWFCDFSEWGFENDAGFDADEHSYGCNTTWKHLELLSSAGQASKSRIQSLTLPKIDPTSITISDALTHMFSSLTALSFNTENVEFLLESSSSEASPLASLVRRTSPTLQTLEFRNMSAPHPQLPSVGEHNIEKLFSESGVVDSTNSDPLVFPKLTTLKLRSLILDTPPLINWLSRQPQLQYAYFEYIYLATIGYKWGDLAERLPPSCNKLYIGCCGHEKWGPNAPAAENHIKKFWPFKEGLPTTSGWQLNEFAFQREMEEEHQRLLACGMKYLPPERWYQGKTREEWVAIMRLRYDHADYERI